MGRIIIFTGKGGVGKTSIAAAHALHSAKAGVKTLLVSTDMAHNLGDLFGQKIPDTGVEVFPLLDVLEVNPEYILEEEFHELKRAVANLAASPGLPAADIEQLTSFPGMDELISLLKIMEIYERGTYGRIIVDCAPTGETLSLLKFPELLSWYMEKFFPVGKAAMRILSPIAKTALKVELPNRKAMNDIERVYLKLMKLQTLLKNRDVSSVRLVCLPEKMVTDETKLNYMYMNLYNFQVDGLYINRILPGGLENPFFHDWLAIQKNYIADLENSFAGIPVYKIPWYDSDLNGIDGLERLEQEFSSSQHLFDITQSTLCESYEQTETGYLLKLAMPFARKQDISLHESGTDLIIQNGGFQRNIPIPYTLKNYNVVSAVFEHDSLLIHFEKNKEEELR